MGDTEDEAIMRLTGRLVLDHVTVARFGFDLLDALVILTITHANVDPISRDADLQRRYATYEQAPPEDVRRPISINAVAQSLGIPFETVRRRVVKMSLLGLFRMTKQGVVIPNSMVHNRRNRAAQESAYVRARALHDELDRNGWGEAAYPDIVWTGAEPLRLTARVTTDYFLRLVHLLMDETGDPLAAAVWLGIFCENAQANGAEKPQSMASLARRLRLSTETVRRRVQALVAQGLCTPWKSTAIVDGAVLARPGVQRLLTRNRQDLKRMFGTLAEYGVPQAWRAAARDAERGASSAAA